MLGSAQLAHASAEARFKCYLFRKSAMSQRLILRGLHSAALSHAEMEEAADTYTAPFAAAPKEQQVCKQRPGILELFQQQFICLPACLCPAAMVANADCCLGSCPGCECLALRGINT